MTTHSHHGDHGDHGGHHEPTNFFFKYVFSTDHKVIGIQFMFASLLFVILGGLLALGVRYQLAWPNQNVPYAEILPGKMTSTAPEANPGLWKVGSEVVLRSEVKVGDTTIPAGARATLTGFPRGFAVTLPKHTVVERSASVAAAPLAQPQEAFISPSLVMGDYDYTKIDKQVRTVPGATVTVPGGAEQAERTWTLKSRQVPRPDGSVGFEKVLLLPVRPEATAVTLDVPAQTVKVDDKELSVPAATVGAEAGVTAAGVTYNIEALTTDAYLQLFTMHASIMIFFVIIPMLVGAFGNFVVPLMVGARDMAFPKLNALSFWLSVPAGVLMLISFWTQGGAAGGGWTMYPTLSHLKFTQQLGTTLWIASVGLVGFSSIVGSLNYITTIINMRAPGMTMFRMPLTVWSILITATLALFSTPVLTAAMIMLLLDRTMGTMFFKPEGGGQVILWQHLFWFYSHPAVYIMILPAMGVVSDVLATFSRKPIFGYRPMVFAICGIAGLGFIVWGHHMFQSGMNPILGTTFMASTIMIALPSAIKTFNWLGTIWGGNVQFTPAMLNALAFVSMFVIGGLSGIFMASAPVDIHIHDTYFIVAHIHYVLFGGSLFGIFAGIYYWFPKMFGRQLNPKWGVVHTILTVIAFNGTFFLMHVLGVGGAPRRYATHLEYPTLAHLQPMNVVMTIFALMLGMAQIPFLYNFFVSLPRKLGRAMVALFAVMLTLPSVIGLTFYDAWDRFPALAGLFGAFVVPVPAEGVRPFGQAIAMASVAGVLAAAITVGVVFAVWFVGGRLRAPQLLQRLLYIIVLPAFMAPMIVKKDIYMMLGVPTLHDYAAVLLLLCAVPGVLYLLAVRPRDEFGYAAEANPWHANSLEWATTSPPPFTNFETIPTVRRGPYEYSSPVVEEDYLPQPAELPRGVVEPSGH